MDGPVRFSQERRYDVDWLRTIAVGLLIIFHIMLSFQAWAESIEFPQNGDLLEGLVPFVSMLSIWRIPLLFLISGMGVRFALERRDWKELLKDRTIRILIPYLVGILGFGTILSTTLPLVGWDAEYTPNFGHLWFLLNIFLYVVWLLGLLIYLKDQPHNALFRYASKILRWPGGLLLFALPLVLEATLVNPEYFASYVDSVHGWLLGLICFFLGFLLISLGDLFWLAVARMRWLSLGLASSLFLVRFLVFDLQAEPNGLIALESWTWMLTVLGFGSLYLNRPSRTLGYLSRAVYPVYIVHLPFQFVIACFLFPGSLPAYPKLLLLTAGTFGLSLLLYEYVLRRVRWVRPLFGMKLDQG
jgi:glucan biosynthesis protein C